MAFDDLERRVQCHPVKQIRELTQASSDSANHLAAGKLHSFEITLLGGRFANALPKRERLARFDQNAVDSRTRDLQILNLILLQLRVRIAEPSSQKGLVFFAGEGELVLICMACEADTLR